MYAKILKTPGGIGNTNASGSYKRNGGAGSGSGGSGKPDMSKPIADHPYHSKTDEQLRYIQRDAHDAAVAMGAGHPKEGKYLGQVNDASTVLGYRQRTKQAHFDKGVRAGKAGKFSTDNPHPKGSFEHEQYSAGMAEGRSQASKRRTAKKADNGLFGIYAK